MNQLNMIRNVLINVILVFCLPVIILAQPSISLWKVNQAHIDDHSHAEAYLLECGSEYYVNYNGAGSHEDIIINILNEGDEALELTLPLSLTPESSGFFEITHQPEIATLEPGEEVHFVVKYNASPLYHNAKAQIFIASNDSENSICSVSFDVGEVACANCPTLSQAFLPNSIGPFSTTTVQYTINNNSAGAVNVTDLQFTDNLTSMIFVADPPRASTDCTDGVITANAGGTTISFSNARLSAGSSCVIRVDVTSSDVGMKTNTTDPLQSNLGTSNSASANLNIDASKVGIIKTFSPSSIPPSGVSELKIEMKNLAEGSLSGFSVHDILPLGMTFAQPLVASHNCSSGTLSTSTLNGRSNIFFNFGVIAPGDCYIKVNVTADEPGTYINTAVEQDFFYTSSAELDVPVNFLTKSFSDDPVKPGGQVTLDFMIQNPSRTSAASNISFTDDLDAVLSGLVATGLPMSNVCGAGSTLSGTSSLTFSGGSLLPEGNCIFSVVLDVPAGAAQGSYTNTTSAITADIDGDGVTGNPATDILVVSDAPILTKSFMTDPIVSGQDVVMNFTLMNPSSSTATDISFTDEFAEIFKTASPTMSTNFCNGTGLYTFTTLIDPDPPASTTPATLRVSGITLLSGGSCSFSITLNSDDNAPGGVYPNTTSSVTAMVGGASVTGNPASDDITVLGPPRLKKDFEPGIVSAGAMTSLKFEITHDENAVSDATSISFTDDLDAALSGLEATGLPLNNVCGAGSMISGTSTLSFSGGSLSPGSNCVFSVPVLVPSSASPGIYTNKTSSLTATINGVSTMGNEASDALVISGLEFSKEFIDDPKIPGETGILRFSIDNSSSQDATNITFSDDFREVLDDLVATGAFPMSDVCGSGSNLTYSTSLKTLSLSNGSLMAGTSCNFDVEYLVPTSAANALYTNTTTPLMADFGSTSAVLSPASDILEVDNNRLKIQKEFTENTVAPGGNINLKFIIENLDMVNPASDLSFTDDLSTALTGLIYSAEVNNTCPMSTLGGLGTSTITFSGGTLSAGGMCEIEVTVTAPSGATIGTYTNNSSKITGKINSLDVEGLPATDDLSISVVKFSKTMDPAAFSPDTIDLMFSLENLSSSLVHELAFNDILNNMIPGAVAIGLPMTDVCGMGSMVSGTNTISLTNGSLPSMSSCNFKVQVAIPANVSTGTYTNTTSNLRSGSQNVSGPTSDSVFIYPDVASQNQITFGDPCSCSDALNCDAGSVFYFHDTLTIPMTLTTTPGLLITISNATDIYIDVPCNGGSLVLATPGTPIPETVPGSSGVYKLEFWRPSGVLPTLNVQIGVMSPIMVPPSTFVPLCMEADCITEPIPTAGNWGLISLSLLLLIIGVVSMNEKVKVT